MRKKISSDTFQKFLTRSAYLVFPSEISHLLPIQSSKSEYIYSEFQNWCTTNMRKKDLWHKFWALLEKLLLFVFRNYSIAYIQFVFVGCWVSSSGTHSYLFPTQKVPLAQKELFGVFFVANRIVDFASNCTLFSFVFLCSWVLWPLCRRQTIILASLPLYPYPFHNFSTFAFIILSTCLCYYFLHILASLTPLLTFL